MLGLGEPFAGRQDGDDLNQPLRPLLWSCLPSDGSCGGGRLLLLLLNMAVSDL